MDYSHLDVGITTGAHIGEESEGGRYSRRGDLPPEESHPGVVSDGEHLDQGLLLRLQAGRGVEEEGEEEEREHAVRCESVVPVQGSISQAEMRPAVSSHHSLHHTDRSSSHNLPQAVQSYQHTENPSQSVTVKGFLYIYQQI